MIRKRIKKGQILPSNTNILYAKSGIGIEFSVTENSGANDTMMLTKPVVIPSIAR